VGGIFSGVLGGLIAAAVTILGWFATAYLRRGEDRRQYQLGFLERQIAAEALVSPWRWRFPFARKS
jgi:predicted acyltransferase